MNCQEVMELMQRELDGDLEAQEQDELQAHLARCLDCAQMFERLQRLSDELTQLPKVIPPYSLVDAILPQLTQLDKKAAASITDKVAVLGTNASPMNHGQTSKVPRTRRIGSHFSWKFAGGIVAAGLILGFFAFNLQHPVLDNADGILQSKSSAESKSSAQDVGAVQKKTTDDSSAPAAAENPAAKSDLKGTGLLDTMNQEKLGPTASPASGTGPQATTDAKLEKPQAISQDAAKGSDQLRVAPTTSEPERMKDPGTPSSSEKKVIDDATVTNPSALPAAPDKKADSKEANPLKVEPTPTPLGKKGSEASDIMGLQSLYALPVTELHSATDVYVAVIEKQHVVIRSSATKEVVFESKQVWQTDDPITLVEWSKDDILFYQVQSGGSLHTNRIDMKNKTEVSP